MRVEQRPARAGGASTFYARPGRVGANTFKLGRAVQPRRAQARAGGRAVYRMVVTRRDAAGNKSPARTRKFRVVR